MSTNVTTDGISVAEAIERFNDAVNRHDVDAIVAAMTDDSVWECTQPPDGDRYAGADIRAGFERLFATARYRRFDAEEMVIASDRAIVRWLHRWVDLDGVEGHVRGVDLFTVRDGKVAEKLSYVKG